MHFRRTLLTAILSLLPIWGMSADAKQSQINSFYVKPGLCIVDRHAQCKQTFIFGWLLNSAMKACLYQANEAKPLHCVSNRKQAELSLLLDLDKSHNFTLKVENEFAHQKINVRELGKDVRQSRRHLWSVF